jgi:hypothetical protein
VFLQGESEYEEWKYHKNKNIVEVIEEFSSLTVTAALLLTQLPRLQPVKFQSRTWGIPLVLGKGACARGWVPVSLLNPENCCQQIPVVIMYLVNGRTKNNEQGSMSTPSPPPRSTSRMVKGWIKVIRMTKSKIYYDRKIEMAKQAAK